MTTECIEWWGGKANSGGYGFLRVSGQPRQAHRHVWEECFGPIPEGMYVCHHCDNPPCVNPEHLFLGTQSDNMRDREAKGRANRAASRKTHCPQGHPYDGENTYRPPGNPNHRMCRICVRERHRRRSLMNTTEKGDR